MSTHGRILTGQEGARALAQLAEAEDRRAGIRERFLTPTIGGGRTVAVLATPLGEPRPMGWVVCHSFGMEQVTLSSHEIPMARRLAAAGFPVLRYHGQGYGDSELPPERVGLTSHLRDALYAVDALTKATGVTQVGFLGARFGGTVAALSAEQIGAAALVAWEPVTRGSSYARALLTLSVLLQLMHRQREDDSVDPKQELMERGVLDVQGFPFTREAYEELVGLDLVERMSSFRGRSLIVQVSRGSDVRPEIQRLASRLRALGGRSEVAVVTDERAKAFGEPRFKPTTGGHKVDTQERLGTELQDRTIEWSLAGAEAAVSEAGR